jgi:hypothetical protein
MKKEAEGSVVVKLNNFVIKAGPRHKTRYEFRCFTVAQLAEEQGLPLGVPLHLIGVTWHLDPGELFIHHVALFSSKSEDISKCDPKDGLNAYWMNWSVGADRNYMFPPDVGILLAGESQGTKKEGLSLGYPSRSDLSYTTKCSSPRGER